MCDIKLFYYLVLINLAGMKLIIDTDAGVDDGLAILNILGNEDEIEVQFITTVFGNTHVDNVGRNVLKTLKVVKKLHIPVYKGANQSLLVTPKTGDYFGKDGFGDFYFPDPPSEQLIKPEHAVTALIQAVNSCPGELTLLCIGPLTNIALAIRLEPQFLNKLKEIYVLGGSDSGLGNVKPGVEFNFYMDPEAAFIVIKEAEKNKKILNLLTWETVSKRSTIEMEWRKKVLGAVKSPQMDLINKAENSTLTGENWISADAILSSVIIDSKIKEASSLYHADLEISGEHSRGALFVDFNNSTNLTKNVLIIEKINVDSYDIEEALHGAGFEILFDKKKIVFLHKVKIDTVILSATNTNIEMQLFYFTDPETVMTLITFPGIKMTLVQPTPEQQLKIRSELNENVDTRAQDLQTIKEWLELQPHLPKTFDDGRLMTFLRGCKFSLEKTKRKLDMYFTMRAAIPEFFSNRNPFEPSIQEIMKQIHIPPLPGLTPEGRRVIIMRGVDKDQATPNVAEAMKIVFMIGDVRLLEESIGVGGDVYILDAAAATPAHFAKFTPTLIKKFLVCAQEAYPVKLKEVHIVNVSPLVDTIVNFVKPFLKEKIKNRIFFHTDGYNSLYKYVPKEILPEEYGGFAGPIAEINDQWLKKLESYKDWFLSQEDIKADENKRPGKPKTHDDLFGVEGSFRKLVID